jgi:sarcosine oxidase
MPGSLASERPMHKRFTPNVVLGAGAMGSAAAYHLASRGEPVVLIEQFALGHDRGSSHGAARIIRHSYADPAYARLMLDAFRAWRELEGEAGRPLFLRTGGVSITSEWIDYVERVATSLATIDVPHTRMTGKACNRNFPAFGLKPHDDVVFEPDAGLILAERAVTAQVELAVANGAEVFERSPVRRIDLDGSRPILLLDDVELETTRLIVTAGAWTSRLLPTLAVSLQPTRQQVLYYRPANPTPFAIGQFPVFIFMGEQPLDAYYGMPDCLGMGVKVARHGGPEVDPSVEDRAIDPAYVDQIRGFLARTIPSLSDAPIDRSEVCLYTMAEGENFRIGKLPGRDDVIVASPCSGHGFKFSTLIGRVLADLAIDGTTSIDIRPWLFT